MNAMSGRKPKDLEMFDAISNRDPELLTDLLSRGGNADATNRFGAPLLSLAMALDRDLSLDMVARLLDAGADPNIPDVNGYTPLMMAVFERDAGDHPDMVRLLVSRGADPNAAARDETALTAAVKFDHAESAEALLDLGADIHWRDSTGCDALMFAAEARALRCAEILLERGASVDTVDGDSGRNAYEIAGDIDDGMEVASIIERHRLARAAAIAEAWDGEPGIAL